MGTYTPTTAGYPTDWARSRALFSETSASSAQLASRIAVDRTAPKPSSPHRSSAAYSPPPNRRRRRRRLAMLPLLPPPAQKPRPSPTAPPPRCDGLALRSVRRPGLSSGGLGLGEQFMHAKMAPRALTPSSRLLGKRLGRDLLGVLGNWTT